MSDFQSDKLVVIGVGLIGGSVAAALRRAGRVRRVVGVGRSRTNIERALERGVIDEAVEDVAAAVEGADMVMLAVPVRQTQRILSSLAGVLQPDTLVTDAGSTKQDFVASVRQCLPGRLAQVVPGHPIAGAELTGVEAATPDLFQSRTVVLTPLQETAAAAVDRVEAMWIACGARVARMSPYRHDQVFSAVSHLPHVLAYTLVDMIAGRADAQELFGFAAGGFRDFTRIAGSSPEMWRDIALANREALLADIEAYQQRLTVVAERLRAADADQIEAVFAAARNARNAWLQRCG